MNTQYNQIVDIENIAQLTPKGSIAEVIHLSKNEQIIPASEDKRRVLVLAIDEQNDFMEGIGTLPVIGSKDDIAHFTKWIYNNLANITQIMCSMDCHTVNQIFHAEWWMDKEGNYPTPFTEISYKEVAEGIWKARNGECKRSLQYLRNLEKNGNKKLCIWPYHCIEGTAGAQLEGEFAKMVYYHAAVRRTSPRFIYKGQDPFTEMYGVIKAEYDPANYINHSILDAIKAFDEVYIAGEASSHCVLASVTQIAEYYRSNKELTSRITILTDCMSPIVGYEKSTKEAFEKLSTTYGIKLKTTQEVTL